MPEEARLLDGPYQGEVVGVSQERIALPLDRNLNPLKNDESPYAFAIYEREQSQGAASHNYKFVGAQRNGQNQDFEVEFVDGPMKGTHQFEFPYQLLDIVVRIPLDANHAPLQSAAWDDISEQHVATSI